MTALSRLKCAGYHILPWKMKADESCDNCAHRREVAKRARPLELRLTCGKHRANVDDNGWCLNFKGTPDQRVEAADEGA